MINEDFLYFVLNNLLNITIFASEKINCRNNCRQYIKISSVILTLNKIQTALYFVTTSYQLKHSFNHKFITKFMYFKNIVWYSTFNFSSSFQFTVHTFTFTEFTALSVYAVTMDTLLAAGECWTLDTATLVAAIARHFKTVCALFFTVLHWGTDWVGIGTLTDFYSFFIHLVPFFTVQVTVGWNTQRGSNINPKRHHHLENLPLHVYLLYIHLISLFFF